MKKPFDLLSTVEYGGCSAKLPPQVLEAILKEIQFDRPQQLLVGAETSDDAAVWKIDENSAIIHKLISFLQYAQTHTNLVLSPRQTH